MKRVPVLARWSVVLLMLGVFGGTMLEAAAPEPLLLTGGHWQTMSPEVKIAYISGVGNLVEYERHQLDAPPAERQRKSFLPYLARGLSGISINEVVSRVDNYYAKYPDQLKRPAVFEHNLEAGLIPELSPDGHKAKLATTSSVFVTFGERGP
jgi:hypothetical protein